jgi:hypothetical protein
VHDFPAGRFAVWATAWLSGRTSYDEALDALLGETAHRVTGLPGTDEAVPLGWALTALRGEGERRFRLVLPVPGDVRGLPKVPGLGALALESGQAAVGERLALVPEEIGPEAIAWTVFPLEGAPPLAPAPEGSLRAAAGALDLAIGDAARALADLDRVPPSRTPRPRPGTTPCARWRPPSARRRSRRTTPSRARNPRSAGRDHYGRPA